jgi:hypothetical protein
VVISETGTLKKVLYPSRRDSMLQGLFTALQWRRNLGPQLYECHPGFTEVKGKDAKKTVLKSGWKRLITNHQRLELTPIALSYSRPL